MKIIVKCKKGHRDADRFRRACINLNIVQSYFSFSFEPDDGSILDGSESNPSLFLSNHQNHDQKTIYITDCRFDDNWFSHEERDASIITTYDWNQYYAPPSVEIYVIYQCAQAAIGFVCEMDEESVMNFIHYDTQGCMFDFCQHKDDIKLGMLSGSICPQCKGILVRYGVEEKAIAAIEKILEYVRSFSIGRPTIISNQAFIVMRFTEHDENDNAYLYGIKEAFKELGIEEVRADTHMDSAPILQQVRRHIETSRFIVAKVDEKNLNVYYELGLAMGLNKDVLLVSENSLVLDLPSDLNNWRCLTYPKGDYKNLKASIVSYYRDNYTL